MLNILKFVLIISLLRPSQSQLKSFSRSSTLDDLRLNFYNIPGAFTETQVKTLEDKVFPSVQSFYSSALKVPSIRNNLIPANSSCLSLEIPEDHLKTGLKADVIIYVTSNSSLKSASYAKVCQQESGLFKRPVVGFFAIKPAHFFKIFESMQIKHFIRGMAHILAFDEKLFEDFVKPDGSPYSKHQKVISIYYPNRETTVRALAFPKMLQRARSTFDCEVEGVEFEDSGISKVTGEGSFFWSSRIITHDILSRFMGFNVIFSDISLAVFEDSGWYLADYSYSNTLKWGYMAGCSWFEEKCIRDEKTNVPGFCGGDIGNQCDEYGLGYGTCMLNYYSNIPPHEQYFKAETLGGIEDMDFCPIINPSLFNICRNTMNKGNEEFGEKYSINSMCFVSSLTKEESTGQEKNQRKSEPACYQVTRCDEKAVSLNIENIDIYCPFGLKVPVTGFSGFLRCPESKNFCKNIPCINFCSGRGKCVDGNCICNNGWFSYDCSEKCQDNCAVCLTSTNCFVCQKGYYLNSNVCVKCLNPCKTCIDSGNKCTSCFEGYELVINTCNSNCLPNCNSCDSPCTSCDLGFALIEGSCTPCQSPCKECTLTPNKCTECIEGFSLINNRCVVSCLTGCIDCSRPCTQCKVGYFLTENICELCEDPCASCLEKPSKCTSCFEDYRLENFECIQVCSDHCISCDSPCTLCEDGYYLSNNKCEICDYLCVTCSQSSSICTKCIKGYVLVGSTCKIQCDPNCSICSQNTCQVCKDGFFMNSGICYKCDPTCKTCSLMPFRCESCEDGYSLVYWSCINSCNDHCVSCDFPCTQCEIGYFEINSICSKCHNSCSKCNGPGNANCLSCSEGFKMVDEICKPICQDNCLTCDEPCTKCVEGYFNYELGCSKCLDSCKSCSGHHFNCTSCKEGFGLIYNFCHSGCDDHCASCDVPCSKCESGYFFSNSVCVACDFSCKECSFSSNLCTSCPSGFYLDSSECKRTCLKGCKTCDFPCLACVEGFSLINGECRDCPTGCLTCSPTSNDCFSCKEGYLYSRKQCSKVCLPNCESCDDPCSSCKSGYLLVSGICQKCFYPCTSCVDNLEKCTSCSVLYKLNNFKCESSCLEFCLSCDDPCSTCLEGYFLTSNSCKKCSSSCKTCEFSHEHCTSCFEGFFLIKNTCFSKCVDNCADCSVPCRVCNRGFALKDGKCLTCLKYFFSHQVKAEFFMNFKGLALVFDEPVLDSRDICDVYFKDSTLAELGVGALCRWSSDDRLVVEFGNKFESSIRVLEMHPVVSFGNDCNSDASDMTVYIQDHENNKPKVSIIAPMFFSLSCGSQVLTIQGLTEEENYSFTISANLANKGLENYVYNATGKILVIPEYLLSELILNITFTATNSIKLSSSVSHSVKISKDKNISLSLDSGSHLVIHTSQEITIRGIVTRSYCVSKDLISFNWMHLFNDEFDYHSKLSNALVIKKGGLKAGKKYVFRLTARSGNYSAFSDVSIDVLESPLVLKLDRSDSSFNVNKRFALSAEGSFDPDDPKKKLKFEWECLEKYRQCVDRRNELILSKETSQYISVAPKRLISGREYLFKVTISFKNKSSAKSVLIKAVDFDGDILIPSLFNTVNLQRNLAIFPVFSLPDQKFQFKWQQVSGREILPIIKNDLPYLVIPANSLTSGVTYKISITASFEKFEVFSNFEITTNSGPKCGDIEKKIYGPSVILSVNCFDGDYNDFPLSYMYGVKRNESFFPLRLVHCPSSTFDFVSGNYSLYIDICDSLDACEQKLTTVSVKSGDLNEKQMTLLEYKKYSDSLPLIIFNNIKSFDKENFIEAFKSLQEYILALDLKLVHLKMAIECLEVLTSSEKGYFMKNYQEKIIDFLLLVVQEVKYIDDDSMNYVIRLFSEHEIINYSKVSNLIEVFSEKWAVDLAPGESKNISNKVQLVIQRFEGNENALEYNFDLLKVSDIKLQGDPNKIYDIILIKYPSEIAPVVDIKYYEIGTSIKFTYKILSNPIKVSNDLERPLKLSYKLKGQHDMVCVQYIKNKWVEEGCDILIISDSSVTVSIWHLSLYKISYSITVRRTYIISLVEALLISFTITAVSYFCILDRNKLNYSQANFSDSDIKQEKNLSDEPLPKDSQEIKNKYKLLLYHPVLNIFIRQTGNRRPASILHFTAVCFCELICTAVLFNPDLGVLFDDRGAFQWFSSSQVEFFIAGLLLTQILSALISSLNRAGAESPIKKFIAIITCIFLICVMAGLGINFENTYPAIYCWYWLFTFFSAILIDFLIFQSISWAINYYYLRLKTDVFSKMDTKNIRVFTEDS